MRDQILNRCPVRREHEHFIAGIYDRLKRAEQTLHAAIDDNDIFDLRRNAVARPHLAGDRFAQFENAG